ncbi:hypothetical protein RD792_002586 [Penstemon davidsonii]|uniref:Uncharacterized protein n=1 Tax=Penstemon davidsonii TaxID=160366 RepID=A0ABR0DRI4_9LAMI|nr:hypothetical protein RD792_002586 [Penstemon davidsonii]
MNRVFLLFILSTAFGISQIQVSLGAGASIDFFYLLLQWPGSQCNTKQGCCFPVLPKKPNADFIIASLQPFYYNGTFPKNCDSTNRFDLSKVMDLKKSLTENWPSLTCPRSGSKKLWADEWRKYGTCSKPALTEHEYFEAALNIKKKVNLLNVLSNKAIKPDSKSYYRVGDILDAIRNTGLNVAGIYCNVDKKGKSQLDQAILCTDPKVSAIVECPGIPMTGICGGDTAIKFPPL